MNRRGKVKNASEARHVLDSIVPGKRWRIFLPRRIIWQKWEEIVGGPVASAAWPWYFKDTDCLVIAVSDSIWMQQLAFESPALIEKINHLLPLRSHLSRLRFRLSDIKNVRERTLSFEKKESGIRKRFDKTRLASITIDDTAMKLLEKLDDPVLQKSFKNLLIYLSSDHVKG